MTEGEPVGEVLDLTGDPPVVGGLPTPVEKKFDPEPGREKVRGHIAEWLTLAVALLALLAFSLAASGVLSADQIERLQVFYTPLITLCGTALGFYFGGKHSR